MVLAVLKRLCQRLLRETFTVEGNNAGETEYFSPRLVLNAGGANTSTGMSQQVISALACSWA